MKLFTIVAFIHLNVMVNGAFWAAAAVRPVILGMGAILAALDMDIQPMFDVKLFEMPLNSGRRSKLKDPYSFDEDDEEEREEREERMREEAAEGE